MQWCVIGAATPAWAARVYPDVPALEAEACLWDAIFQVCRVDTSDPEGFWAGYIDRLTQKREDLTAKQYSALHLYGSGTDLLLGLPPGHIWAGGGNNTQKGIPFMPNLPTEEVFSLPHKYQVNGTVRATKPLNYEGNLIEGFSLTFKDGRVEDFSADQGEALLGHLLDTDENARYLGEIALVPHRSPISVSGLLFKHTLYDENAASHLALGKAYRTNLEGADTMSEEEFDAAGGNTSLVHQDFMFGSADMAVDGLLPGGTREPVMRAGEWVDPKDRDER
jgi:aminopeptidase